MSTTTFEWDEQNNLSAMTLPGGSREEYVHSADGLRRQKKVNGAVTHYIWDEQNLLQEKDASLQTKVQYTTQPHGYGPLLSQRRFDAMSPQSAQFNAVRFGSSQFNQGGSSPAVPQSTFYGTDLSGNVRSLTDSSGAVTDRYVTTAFGKPISSTGSTTNPYRFGGAVGYYQDNAQRYYVRKRYLNTNQARWISPDPIGFNGRDWNLYRYNANNPRNRIDPSGLVSLADAIKARITILNDIDWLEKNAPARGVGVAKCNLEKLKRTYGVMRAMGIGGEYESHPISSQAIYHWLYGTGAPFNISYSALYKDVVFQKKQKELKENILRGVCTRVKNNPKKEFQFDAKVFGGFTDSDLYHAFHLYNLYATASVRSGSACCNKGELWVVNISYIFNDKYDWELNERTKLSIPGASAVYFRQFWAVDLLECTKYKPELVGNGKVPTAPANFYTKSDMQAEYKVCC